MQAFASTIYENPYVTFSPDKTAWTTCAGDQNVEWYETDGSDDVETGVGATLRALEVGEHYYPVNRTGDVPIEKWVVALSKVNCCHTSYPDASWYPDIGYRKQICLKPHFSAWHPICADCKEPIVSWHVYMSKDAAASIGYWPAGKGLTYYYLCPFNQNLEQGVGVGKHRCKAISANRYKVEYRSNSSGAVSGYMAPSFHFYQNATIYEGQEVTPQTKLNPNQYSRVGYQFVGWNTRADGSGDLYPDEAEILNLSTEEYDEVEGTGCVTLYAMWEKSTGKLEIILGNCWYKGVNNKFTAIRTYGEVYRLDSTALILPKGNTFTFQTNGGSSVSPIIGEMEFVAWEAVGTLAGKLEGDQYYFLVPDGNVDKVTPFIQRKTIVLPETSRENYTFAGWYYDAQFQNFAGSAGDIIVPTINATLYAQWNDLVLTSADNYKVNGGKGAVDLNWKQGGDKQKIYKIYQKEDDVWRQVLEKEDIQEDYTYEIRMYGPSKRTIYVPYSGFYRVVAYGSQGGDYGGFRGGKGGYAESKVWLPQGTRLDLCAGGQNGFFNGGKATIFANGGGMSYVSVNENDYLVLAGGGGGACVNEDGYPGGTALNLMGQSMGGTGSSGGGGGYFGGLGGTYRVHNHVPGVCGHMHEGSPTEKGGCYTIPEKCGLKLQHTKTRTSHWYWGGNDEEYCPACGADASKGESCSGHDTDYYKHVCSVHGKQKENTSESSPATCSVIVGYLPSCGRENEYYCGYEEGEILYSSPGYGGTNYIDTSCALAYSTRTGYQVGNGKIVIQSEMVGLQENTDLSGVSAPDLDPPDSVEKNTVYKSAVENNSILLSWKKPEDYGTFYYHRVESYDAVTGTILCKSNITKNIITTGVCGYYYCVDDTSDTDYRPGQFQYITEPKLQVKLREKTQFLHLAAVDVAGNVSEVIHINLGNLEQGSEDVAWPIRTEKLQVAEGENVYFDENKEVFFVRCDGQTPFRIENKAYMEGPVNLSYQINHSNLIKEQDGKLSKNRTQIPLSTVRVQERILENKLLQKYVDGELALLPGNYAVAQVQDFGGRLCVTQDYILGKEDHGKTFVLYPQAGASLRGEINWSDSVKDYQNRIQIIGDGMPPEIEGVDVLRRLSLLDRRKQQVELVVTATDSLSGVKDIVLEIQNLDNGDYQVLLPDERGEICVNITEDMPIFSGDFTVTVRAHDRVENEVVESYSTTEFDLKTEIRRVLAPHDPSFKKGEYGCLSVTTWGYVQRVEVEYPKCFDPTGEKMNQTFTYLDNPSYKQEETLYFMIPLYVPDDENYQITVRAYKEDKMLEEHPQLEVLSVRGSVLDELRTRLR